jgi:hypothetical protein
MAASDPVADIRRFIDADRMRKLFILSAVLSLGGCGDNIEESYATWAEAKRAGAVERGWLPRFVPTSARDIHDAHDLDTNGQRLTFNLPPEAVQPMLDSFSLTTSCGESLPPRLSMKRDGSRASRRMHGPFCFAPKPTQASL